MALEGELSIADWQKKSQVKKSMRVKIKGELRGKVEPKDMDKLTISLMELIKRN